MTGQYIVGPYNLLKNKTDGNMGVVLTSLDGKTMLLENLPEKFETLGEHVPLVTFMNEQEARDFLQENRTEWFDLSEEGL